MAWEWRLHPLTHTQVCSVQEERQRRQGRSVSIQEKSIQLWPSDRSQHSCLLPLGPDTRAQHGGDEGRLRSTDAEASIS